MYATEFKTVINEPFIKIPEFEQFKGKEVRIIVLGIDNDKKNEIKEKEDFIEYLINHPVDFPKDFKFDREEANER